MDKKVLVIIPLHKKDDRVFRAIKSVPEEWELIVSVPSKEIQKFINDANLDKFNPSGVLIHPEGKSSYQDLVNNALTLKPEFELDYINILEFDDMLTPHVKKIIDEYSDADKEAQILAPLACIVKENSNDEKPSLIGISNEASFAGGMSEKNGYLDFNMMLRSNFMFLNGCFIAPSVFEEYGTFKRNFKMFFDYEWALRMVYNGVIIKAIPRASHIHYLYEDSMFEDHKKSDPIIRKKWLEAARREYFFTEDRVLDIE